MFLGFLKLISKGSVFFSGLLIFLMIFYIALDIIFRKAFNFSLQGSDEFGSYALSIIVAWSASYVLFEKMHIRIEILYEKLPYKVCQGLDVLSLVTTSIFSIFLAYFSFSVFTISWEKSSTANSPIATPLWIPQGLWSLGFAFFALCTLSLLVYTLFKILTKQNNPRTSLLKELDASISQID